ncbi:MAG: response regulator [Anaerolineae bacterium]|nr:response regulator [Anaerolineae bacterium]
MVQNEIIHILYMEDDPGLARLFQKKLRRAGYLVDIARDGQEGLDMYQTGVYDVVAMDQTMPMHTGLEVIRILSAQDPLPPMIMVTGTGNEQLAVEAMKLGASDYVVKDVDGGYLNLLPAVIDRVLQKRRLLAEKYQAEEALRHRAAELEALGQISAALRAADTVQEILKIVLEQTAQVTHAMLGFISLIDEHSGEMVVRATYPQEYRLLGKRYDWDKHLIEPGSGADVAHIPMEAECDNPACMCTKLAQEMRDVGDTVAFPLQAQDRTIGVLCVALPPGCTFLLEEVRLLAAAVDIAANALHRALVMEDLEAKVLARTAEIQQEREKSEAILRSVGDAIVMMNLERYIQYVNAAFTTLTGYTAEDVLEQRIDDILAEVQVLEPVWLSVQDESSLKTVEQEVTIRRKDGRVYDAALTIAPMYDIHGEMTGYVVSHQDISRRKDLEEARRKFVRHVSHELRTPASILNAAVHLLQAEKRTSQVSLQESYLQMLEESTLSLVHLIEDILEITSLDSGEFLSSWHSLSLSVIIDDLVTRYAPLAENSGVQLRAMAMPDELPLLMGEQHRLSQALGEIIENAIVFTPTGGEAVISVTLVDAGAARLYDYKWCRLSTCQPWVVITVQDNGVGIPADELPQIFDRFFRGRMVESGSRSGTGLGLSIAQVIVEAHGGHITVESEEGKGSTFMVWLLSSEQEL